MRQEYDFSVGRRGAMAPDAGTKTRITAYIDHEVLEALKAQAEARSEEAGVKIGYQTLLNQLLRQALELDQPPESVPETLTEDRIRHIVREELVRDHREDEAGT